MNPVHKGLTLLLFVLAGCATHQRDVSETNASIKISTSLPSELLSKSTKLKVTIINESGYPICIARDTIENPTSYAMNIKLKDKFDRIIELVDLGIIQEPIQGEIIVESNREISVLYNFGERYKFRKFHYDNAKTMKVKVNFNFWRCSDRFWMSISSNWKPIQIK
jgi:hypothetical protein